MLTLKLITEQTEVVIKGLEKKHFNGAKEAIDQVIATDKKRREAQTTLDQNLSEAKKLAAEIGALMKQGKKDEAETVKAIVAELKQKNEKFYQYTAIDEFTRIRYTWFTNEHSTYMSSEFAKRVKRYYKDNYGIKIETIQTDNGFEFTNRLNINIRIKARKTLFESTLEALGIKHKLIKPYTPKENGRVERSHRKDQERFYYNRIFYSLEDLRNLGKEWRKEYNNFPMRPLNWLSPKEFLRKYKSQEEVLSTI